MATAWDSLWRGINVRLNIRFPGQYYDEETNLHYNWHRYYDPSIGRYITSDPIGLAGGLNTYSYAVQNPTNFNDPDGLYTTAIGRGVVRYGSGAARVGFGAFARSRAGGLLYDITKPEPYRDEIGDDDEINDDTLPFPDTDSVGGQQCPENNDDEFCYERYEIELETCRGLGAAERAGRAPAGVMGSSLDFDIKYLVKSRLAFCILAIQQ